MVNDMDLRRLQDDVGAWSEDNFGVSPLHGGDGSPPEHALLGIGEELGELTRSVLKREQGIDDDQKYDDRDDVGPDAERDAVGDVMIYLMDMIHRCEDDIYVEDGLDDAIEYRQYDGDAGMNVVDAVRQMYAEYGELVTKRYHLLDDEVMEEHAEKFEWASGPPDRLDMVEKFAGNLALNMLVFCDIRGYDFEACIEDAWEEVSGREWDATIAQ